MRCVFLSDTHNKHQALLDVPDGDLLAHAGDSTVHGGRKELRKFCKWFAEQPHRYKLMIAGNHDKCFENKHEAEAKNIVADHGIIYLQDEAITIAGNVFYGAPWTPVFFDWAFMQVRGEFIRKKWNLIPNGVDVLLTHGPPYGHGDVAPPYPRPGSYPRKWSKPKVVGCLELLMRVKEIRPSYHVFGHIHAGYGITRSDELPFTTFINASICDEDYAPVNAPQVIDL